MGFDASMPCVTCVDPYERRKLNSVQDWWGCLLPAEVKKKYARLSRFCVRLIRRDWLKRMEVLELERTIDASKGLVVAGNI